MRSFGLTGGIASGKSTAGIMLREADSGLILFDADACVRGLYEDEGFREEVCGVFGDECMGVDGLIDKGYLREVVFADDGMKRRLEGLIHPRVRKECLAMQTKAVHSACASLFVADVPLLFEGGFDFGQEANLVVAVSRETQVRRLKMRSGFDDATVHAILAAQLPISHKEKCADVVLWNEGPRAVLESQVKRFIENNRS